VVDSRLATAHPAEGLLARNAFYNFLGQAVPLLVAVVSIPQVVHRLGPERFGLLSLAWVVLGYFTIFDLGLGRATTKFVAQLRAAGDEPMASAVITASFGFQLLLGVVGASLLFLLSPTLTVLLRVPTALTSEAYLTFRLLAAALPAILANTSLIGGLEARYLFASANLLKAIASLGLYVVPLIVVRSSSSLAHIALGITVWRWACLGLSLCLAQTQFRLAAILSPRAVRIRDLLSFGSWVTAAALLVPVTAYLDRVFIARLTSLQDLTYYAIPYDLVQRLLVVSSAVAGAAYPMFAAGSVSTVRDVTGRSMRFIAMGLGVPCVLLATHARPILQLWLGDDLAQRSAKVLVLLAVATLINGFGYVPYALAEARGAPRVVALYHALELAPYAALTYVLVRSYGVEGAAVAWLARMGVTIPLFSAICVGKVGLRHSDWLHPVMRGVSGVVAAAVPAATLARWVSGENVGLPALGVIFVAGLIAGAAASWRFGLEESDREHVRRAIGRLGVTASD
jgi:O-antigen/teichoic acid export membrane protein